MFQFSKKSLERLEGLKQPLIDVAMRAIQLSDTDFTVLQGLRTMEEQKKNVASGASQTLRSKHLTGEAIDVALWLGRVAFEPVSLYSNVAEAFADAAHREQVRIRWGAAWHVENIGAYNGSMQSATDEYVALRRAAGAKPFLDYGHFELN